jgi:hypothetical protein
MTPSLPRLLSRLTPRTLRGRLSLVALATTAFLTTNSSTPTCGSTRARACSNGRPPPRHQPRHQAGPDWNITVGALRRDDQRAVVGDGIPVHLSSWGIGSLPSACHTGVLCQDHFSGTSTATPYTAFPLGEDNLPSASWPPASPHTAGNVLFEGYGAATPETARRATDVLLGRALLPELPVEDDFFAVDRAIRGTETARDSVRGRFR